MSVQRSYGGRSAQERTAERRARLLDATTDVLAERGAATTMTAICSAAGLTERYFYESFANVDEALLAALDAVCAEIADLAVAVIASTAGSPEERVHAVMVAFVDLVAQSPAKGRVAVIESNALPHLRARRRELVGSFAELVAAEAVEIYGDRVWPPARARIQGIAYTGGLAELVAAWLGGTLDLDRDGLAAAAADLFEALMRR